MGDPVAFTVPHRAGCLGAAAILIGLVWFSAGPFSWLIYLGMVHSTTPLPVGVLVVFNLFGLGGLPILWLGIAAWSGVKQHIVVSSEGLHIDRRFPGRVLAALIPALRHRLTRVAAREVIRGVRSVDDKRGPRAVVRTDGPPIPIFTRDEDEARAVAARIRAALRDVGSDVTGE